MALLLKIVLGIVLVGLVLIIAAWWWLRRMVSRGVQQAMVTSEWVRDFVDIPARIRLLTVNGTPGAAFTTLWDQMSVLGFQSFGDFAAAPVYSRVRAGMRPDGLMAVVLESPAGCHYALLALAEGQRLWAYSSGPEPAFSNARLQWRKTDLRPDEALQALQSDTREFRLCQLDARRFCALFEAAHATRADAQLGQPISRNDLAAQLRAAHPGADAARIEQALQIVDTHREVQLQLAILDRYRRAQGIDAESWAAEMGDLHVVHDRLDREQVPHLLEIDTDVDGTDPGIQALLQQNLLPTALYQSLRARLPAARQPRLLGRVEQPIPALIYAAADLVDESTERSYLYSARTADGDSMEGIVRAPSAPAAKALARQQGLDDVRILVEPSALGDHLTIEPEMASAAARAVRESVILSLLRATWGNALLWAPPALLGAYSLYEGAPYTWGDYAVAGYAVVALLLLVCFIGPILFYQQLLRARIRGQWGLATLFLRMLEATAWFGAPSRAELAMERAKILAGKGKLSRGMEHWESMKATMSEDAYVSGLVMLFDAAGAHSEMIAAQRRLLSLSAAPEMPTIDLALALARYGGRHDEAEQLLARVNPDGLSELVRGGYHLTRGLVLAARHQYANAARQFQEAGACVQPFSNPLAQMMVAETQGLCAWALKLGGRSEDGERIWRVVGPLLEKVPESIDVVQRYRAASASDQIEA